MTEESDCPESESSAAGHVERFLARLLVILVSTDLLDWPEMSGKLEIAEYVRSICSYAKF